MIIDLNDPRYTQSDVLKMLPDLKAKQLQNWSVRGVLDAGEQKPGKGLRRKHTPAGVLGLDFMQRATDFGIPPASARQMADEYVEAASEFLASEPEVIVKQDGCRWLPITSEKMESFRRGKIVRVSEGEYYLFIEREGEGIPFENRTLHVFNIAVEVDYLVAMAVNRMFLLESGKI